MSSASAGGDALLKQQVRDQKVIAAGHEQQIEDQMEEIQGLLDESEGHSLSGVRKDLRNTELKSQVRHLNEELGAKATKPATSSATGTGFPWSGTSPSTANSSGEPASRTTGSGRGGQLSRRKLRSPTTTSSRS